LGGRDRGIQFRENAVERRVVVGSIGREGLMDGITIQNVVGGGHEFYSPKAELREVGFSGGSVGFADREQEGGSNPNRLCLGQRIDRAATIEGAKPYLARMSFDANVPSVV
jgi:hypothetical protein